jgi:hypothetical protein
MYEKWAGQLRDQLAAAMLAALQGGAVIERLRGACRGP